MLKDSDVTRYHKKDVNKFPWIIERGWPALWSYVPCVSS